MDLSENLTTIKSQDETQAEEVEFSGSDLIVNGIEQLKRVFQIIKSYDIKVEFSYGSRIVDKDVLEITDDGIDTEAGLIEYSYLVDDFGEIWYLTYKPGGDDEDAPLIHFNFTPEEKQRIEAKLTPEELAAQDFEEYASEDEREMFESKKVGIKDFIYEEILKLHKTTLLESKKLFNSNDQQIYEAMEKYRDEPLDEDEILTDEEFIGWVNFVTEDGRNVRIFAANSRLK